ncbi:MAG: tetratricopeptide repeat protein, partial [Ignavibacteriaceae bacterium]
DFYTLARRGSAYTQLKQYTKALQDYNKAIDLAKDNKYALSELYYSRGSVRLFSNQKEKACNDFSKAGELGNSAAFGMIKEYCK